MKRFLAFVICILPLTGLTQTFNYNITFEGIGDNREYFSGKANSQTILGSRGAFEAGIKIDNHQMMVGLSHLLEFGSELNYHQPKLTLYYQYTDAQKDFLFGAFPRRNRINFPLAMLTDTLQYYRPNIEGLYGEVRWGWGHQNAFVDWVSRQTDIKRENFMAGASGKISYKNIFLFFLIFLLRNL